MSHVKVVNEKRVVTLFMNRPERKNALTQAMYQAMANAINDASENMDVKVIVIATEHGFFTAGNDLEDFMQSPVINESAGVYQFLLSLINCKLPLLAAVEGPAIGIGTTMLLHCERVFADETALFALPFINLGLVAEAASSLLLPKCAGYAAAADLLLTGDQFDLSTALQSGIVSETTVKGQTLAAAHAYAQKLVTKPRDCLVDIKALLRRPEEPLLTRTDTEIALFAEKLQGPAVKEAVAAFFDKRAPDFTEL